MKTIDERADIFASEHCDVFGHDPDDWILYALERHLTEAIDDAQREGVIDGLTRYAWWKDGTQYVGTCGTTLKDAILEAKGGGDVGK